MSAELTTLRPGLKSAITVLFAVTGPGWLISLVLMRCETLENEGFTYTHAVNKPSVGCQLWKEWKNSVLEWLLLCWTSMYDCLRAVYTHGAVQVSHSRVNRVFFEVKEIPLAGNKCEIRIKHQRVVIFLLLRGKCRDFIFQRLLLCELTCLLCIIMLDYSHTQRREWWCSTQAHTYKSRGQAPAEYW